MGRAAPRSPVRRFRSGGDPTMARLPGAAPTRPRQSVAQLVAGPTVAAPGSNETLWRSRIDVEVLVPVIASGVKRVVDAIPRSARGLLEKQADVAASVGGRRCSAKPVGDGGQQRVGPVSRARDMDDDRGERHQTRS
jgi:hypothetical protein